MPRPQRGHCAIVPFLHAPGFCKVTADGTFHDASTHANGAMQLYVKSSTPAYKGFKVAFGAVGASRPHPSRHGGATFKANFALSGQHTDWQLVEVPFHRFSIDWSEYTGTPNVAVCSCLLACLLACLHNYACTIMFRLVECEFSLTDPSDKSKDGCCRRLLDQGSNGRAARLLQFRAPGGLPDRRASQGDHFGRSVGGRIRGRFQPRGATPCICAIMSTIGLH